MIYSYAGGVLVPMNLSPDQSKATILGPKSANIAFEKMRIVEFSFPSIGGKTSGRRIIFHAADTHTATPQTKKPPTDPPPNWPEGEPWPPNQGPVEVGNEVFLYIPLSESSLMFLLQPLHIFELSYQNLSDDDKSVETDFGPQILTTHPATPDPGGAMLTRSLGICDAEVDLNALKKDKRRHVPSKPKE